MSPSRTARPWQGEREPAVEAAPRFDPECYLCPGNARAGGVRNPDYRSTFCFDNDFPALAREGHAIEPSNDALLQAQRERGICRVVCFSPRHDLTLARMHTPSIRAVVDTWADETRAAAAVPWIQYVQIFENRGAAMGASNPHPHGQIWATETIPNEPAREEQAMALHQSRTGRCLLCEYADLERRAAERVVCENDAFLAVVPFWAVWPFELLLMARRHVGSIDGLDAGERNLLADLLRRVTTRYDNLFEAPFPYSMGFHQSPARGGRADLAHLHAHFYPPLLRSASIRKFLVGFELLGSPQRDLTAEEAADRLRQVSEIHYAGGTQDNAK